MFRNYGGQEVHNYGVKEVRRCEMMAGMEDAMGLAAVTGGGAVGGYRWAKVDRFGRRGGERDGAGQGSDQQLGQGVRRSEKGGPIGG